MVVCLERSLVFTCSSLRSLVFTGGSLRRSSELVVSLKSNYFWMFLHLSYTNFSLLFFGNNDLIFAFVLIAQTNQSRGGFVGS